MKDEQTMDVTRRFAAQTLALQYDGLPAATRRAACRLILDTFGVGLAGSSGQWSAGLGKASAGWGASGPARVFGRSEPAPAGLAAFLNAYSIHNSEFDCLHEDAVVHALTAILPAVLAVADQQGGVSGKSLIEAVVAGVDIAAAVGLAGTRAMKFFRPAVAGGFGAVAAAGKLSGLGEEQMINAFGAQFAQTSGSMQAHEEGSMLLALQIGFNARAAVESVDMVRAGLIATQRPFEGRFGYFNLFEDSVDLAPVLNALPDTRHIEQVVEKPFPTGRATHGAIEAVQQLIAGSKPDPASLTKIEVTVPPVAHALVGRPAKSGMAANYARLCLAYCVARCLMHGSVRNSHFSETGLADKDALALAQRITVTTFDMEAPSAFGPSQVTLGYADGQVATTTIGRALGHPSNPVSEVQREEKFLANCRAAATPLTEEVALLLMHHLTHLDQLDDIGILMEIACTPSE